jgi:predicted phage terminase large subunit-like protein
MAEQVESVMHLMTLEEQAQAYRLLKAAESLAPPPKPLTAVEIVHLENDLSAFIRAAWDVINPGRKFIWSWHYDLISEYLTLIKQRKLRRLILNVPPRSAKTTFATVCFPVWCWTTNPSTEFLCASHSSDLSTDHSIQRRNLIASPWYQALWGDKIQLASDRNLSTQFHNTQSGKMIATSTSAGAEGKGGDIAILDDPMSSEQSLSDLERFTRNRWVDNTLRQRLNNPNTAAIILIMQRLHELDTTGHVLLKDPGEWKHLTIRLVAEEDETWVFPISGKVVKRKKGEVLQPARFTPEVVVEKERNRLTFAGQYQQRPAPVEGNMIRRSEVRYYGGVDPLTGEADEPLPRASEGEHWDMKLISADCAFKDLKTCDYVCVGVIGVRGRRRVVLDVVNEHLDCDGTEALIRRKRAEHPDATCVLVEDKANGPAVVQRLRRNVSGVVEVNPMGGKVARMFAMAPEWQAGDWYVDRTAAWTGPFVEQLTAFPNAAHDDMCDMASQASAYLAGGANLAEWSGL